MTEEPNLRASALVQNDGSLAPQVLLYRQGFAFVALVVLLALSPLWGIYALFSVFSLLVEAWGLASTGQAGLGQVLASIGFYLLLAAGGTLALQIYADNKLVIDSRGLVFPRYLLFESRFCLSRPWATLRAVQLKGAQQKPGGKPQAIHLLFSDGANIALAFNSLSAEHLKELLCAIQVFAPQADFSPSLRDSKFDLNIMQSSTGLLNLHPSFTELWEQDLAGRFGSTIFVPLEPGQTLAWGGDGKSGRSLRVLGQLSFGGLAAVYLVQVVGPAEGLEAVEGKEMRVVDDRLYVLKEAVLPAGVDPGLQAKALEMFKREARLLSSLRHPRITGVVDYFVHNGRNYILLEHIEGTDLRRFVREQGPQGAKVVVRWFQEILAILRFLHEHEPPVLHRDLTPDNIILARDGHLSLIDFGAANNLVGTATGTIVGKQAYIPAEQFRGKAETGSDIYSLAATMAFALTGEDPEPLLISHPSKLNKKVPAALDQLIAQCTEQEIINRLTDKEQIASRLAELAGTFSSEVSRL